MSQLLTHSGTGTPEKTVTLEQILPHYHFLLVDNCLIHPNNGLSEELYSIRQPEQLFRLSAPIEAMIEISEAFRSTISNYKNVYITPEIKNEIGPLIDHLRQVASYQQGKLSRLERELKLRNGRMRFSHHNRRKNKFLEQRGKEDSHEYEESTQRPIELLYRSADSLQALQEEFPVYQREERDLAPIMTGKASLADASLTAALFEYIQKPENQRHQAAILTADGDIIQLYHAHFATLPPSKQVKLSPQTAVYFQKPRTQNFIYFGYHPPWQVREAARKEKQKRV